MHDAPSRLCEEFSCDVIGVRFRVFGSRSNGASYGSILAQLRFFEHEHYFFFVYRYWFLPGLNYANHGSSIRKQLWIYIHNFVTERLLMSRTAQKGFREEKVKFLNAKVTLVYFPNITYGRDRFRRVQIFPNHGKVKSASSINHLLCVCFAYR